MAEQLAESLPKDLKDIFDLINSELTFDDEKSRSQKREAKNKERQKKIVDDKNEKYVTKIKKSNIFLASDL